MVPLSAAQSRAADSTLREPGPAPRLARGTLQPRPSPQRNLSIKRECHSVGARSRIARTIREVCNAYRRQFQTHSGNGRRCSLQSATMRLLALWSAQVIDDPSRPYRLSRISSSRRTSVPLPSATCFGNLIRHGKRPSYGSKLPSKIDGGDCSRLGKRQGRRPSFGGGYASECPQPEPKRKPQRQLRRYGCAGKALPTRQ